jgi:hypothetical protein
MTQFEIIEEVKKLKPAEQLEIAETILHLVRQDLNPIDQEISQPTNPEPKPFTMIASAWLGSDPNAIYSREEIYEDDAR